jgi:high-affinity K+ transport system ATPase subunit B
MDYSINLATKTRSSLVALSLDERGSNFTQFSEESVKNFTNFSSMVAKAGLQFEHVVKQGAESSVVAKLYDSDEAFRYVLDDIGTTRSKKQVIPVYTRATMRTR